MKIHSFGAAVFLVTLSLPGLAGETVPKWEAGIGVAAFSFPAYRGSDKVHNFALPVPYFTYHGDFLKADRQGIRGSLFDSDRVDFTLSLSASPPTKSDDVAVRSGMPDLKPTAEFGPQVDLTLWRSADRERFLKLRLPARAAFTVEGSPRDVGWVFSPNLNMDIRNPAGLPGWNLGLVVGPIYASKKQHEYFYGVAPRFATAERPAYEARGGYSGSQFLVAVTRRFERTWVGAFLRHDSLHGAVFEDSPLVAKHGFTAAGVSVSWILGASRDRVTLDD
ncbi:MAG TPA: MipA/OmpV family protein [Rhodocyclaceae bacterium]|nr:MipA/OmpV family protein [Rhodocyclaceae bacterium]